ncbi:MAG: SIR2 family protein [Planctomycetota bacterium]
MDRENGAALARLEDAFARASERHANGHALLGLVGAGVSARLGYPLWAELLSALEEEVARVRPEVAPAIEAAHQLPDKLWRAEECRRFLGEARFAAFIRRTFAPNGEEPNGFHDALVRLPFRHVLTTNFDVVLEAAHERANGERARSFAWDGVASLDELLAGAERAYVHLYGRYDGPVVLSEWDFRDRYVHKEEPRDALARVLAAHPIVSIGFSLSDLDLMAVFREGSTHGEREHGGHFAFLPLEKDEDPGVFRRWLKGKFAIEPVFYRLSEKHEELDELISGIRGPCPRAPSTPS